MNIPHIPVLKDEVIEQFKDINDGYIIDCTLGYGGHTSAILEINKNIKMICIDQDIEAINFSKNRLSKYSDRIIFINKRFSQAINEIKGYDVRGILADIGVSSLQIDKNDRGFSFLSDKLDMRMNQNASLDAKQVVNNYSKLDLEKILKEYGDIPNYKHACDLILKNRPFSSSKQLYEAIKALPARKGLNPATLVFQAIRIEVNDELAELERLLDTIYKLKFSNCLVLIISFHSLEDKIVKNRFKQWQKSCICDKYAIKCECGNNHEFGKIITKKPIVPTKDEIKLNSRSSCSKLRVFKTK